MTLREARCLFTRCLADLIYWATSHGYEVAFAEGMDRLTPTDPTSDHMAGSLHHLGLAQDIDLYRAGKWCERTEDHLPLGVYWEELGAERNIPLTWGGRFRKPDGNHYSFTWGGRS